MTLPDDLLRGLERSWAEETEPTVTLATETARALVARIRELEQQTQWQDGVMAEQTRETERLKLEIARLELDLEGTLSTLAAEAFGSEDLHKRIRELEAELKDANETLEAWGPPRF